MPLICYVSDQWGSIRSPYLGHGEVTSWWLAAHPAHQPGLLLKSNGPFVMPKLGFAPSLLAKKHVQMRSMFLDMAQAIDHQLAKWHFAPTK